MMRSGMQALGACIVLCSALFSQSTLAFNGSIAMRQSVEDCDMDPWPADAPTDAAYYYNGAARGQKVQNGKKLRILTIGDSITVGVGGSEDIGYRSRLVENLGNNVVFAGTETKGSVPDNYYAAWSSETIQAISNKTAPSLAHRPNLVLLMAGTNDASTSAFNREGCDPSGAATRLGALVDKILAAVSNVTILVAVIPPTRTEHKITLTKQLQRLIPVEIEKRTKAGKKVKAVDFSKFRDDATMIPDGIHPGNEGYRLMGDWWYSFITQIPAGWITDAQGADPTRTLPLPPINANGGPDENIPAANFGHYPITATSPGDVKAAADRAGASGKVTCNVGRTWEYTGKIATGIAKSGDFKWHTGWNQLGKIVEGIGRDGKYVRMADMNGDGKADYVWLHPGTGMIIVWINNRPNGWAKAGSDPDAIIAVGAGRAETIYLVDLNADGMADYVIVDPENGSVKVWWNYGAKADWPRGWSFVYGGEIFPGVKHANLVTIRFPDINGDGRADLVVVGKGGALRAWLNIGRQGQEDVTFIEQGGIAGGATDDITRIGFADIDGDGRDDYLIWDDDAGLTGFLNKASFNEGVPVWMPLGAAKTVIGGVHRPYSQIRLADMDGDGKDDYILVNDDGSLEVWINRGVADTSMGIDGVRFADIDGDGADDYIWLHPETGAPTVYLNKGADPNEPGGLGWLWSPLNGGSPIAGGAGKAENVIFGDIDGDAKDDYLVLHPETGALTVWLNKGPNPDISWKWVWESIGTIASGLGPGKNVRFADMDGDGYDDYILLRPGGGFIVYRNNREGEASQPKWLPSPQFEAEGIGRRPEEITFKDVNGDGKADYIWTHPTTGASTVWLNNFPMSPKYLQQPEIAGGVGVSGNNVRYVYVQKTGRASYVALDQNTGAFSAWLYNCPFRGFDIYRGSDYVWDSSAETWQIFPAEPSCDDAWKSPLYYDRDDVSSSYNGVRCEDGCDESDPGEITILEMKFHEKNPSLHWTIYKDRGYGMYGLDGKVYGYCSPFPGDDYLCAGVVGSRGGVRKFRCLTEWTAKQITDTWGTNL
ncbi:hypothetical protein VTL71DRAFT_2854 [Oculimacula yallundae]|uniref:SGNH hydrolase-type esterase domain-containing protein n=1 Tax=Oculimacula yallundae TaxID=86028 RepID=A0ABR4CB82_9HELO